MRPGQKFSFLQFAVRAKFARAAASLQNLITHSSDVLLIIMESHGITKLLIHIDQLVGFNIGDVYHFIQLFKEFPYPQSGLSSPLLVNIITEYKLGNQVKQKVN